MTAPEEAFDELLRAALVGADLPPEQMADLVPYMGRQPDLADLRGREITDLLVAELTGRIWHASTYYLGSKGHARIAEMANGHIHNALAAMKRRRLAGLDAFTILALEAEITKRAAARAEENP